MDSVTKFTQNISETYSSGHAREHSYRPALKDLFESISGLKVINEPKRSEYGAPDFVFLKSIHSKDKIVIAYAEAKDINVSLDDIEKSEQMGRYYGYSNIILTNGLDFRFYRNATSYGDSVVIGKLNGDRIDVFKDQFQLLADTISGFIKESKEPIKSGTVLSKVMAGKARRIRDNVKKFLEDEKNPKNENLLGVYGVIKKLLLADLDHVKFADMYAQTIVYGLFVARYHDKTSDNFSRQEARDLVPSSNPFLRHFFDHIAGSSFDSRIEYIVNELCEEFNHADVQAIVHDYYKVDKDSSRDPIIHFYEDFLQEYDPIERKKMGVFYTPLPVVRFIVRAVDDLLKKEFNLTQGLSDSTKIDITKEVQGKKHKVPVHKVQVLDPATGTGTFLNEVILHIKKSFEGQEGRWSSYVNTDLLPRIHGFELMMASYTIAHLKLSSTITETGAKTENNRLGVYLTNSLEKAESEEKTLFDIGFGKAITEESNQANKVKNELPIMVVIGNPPYSGSSSNETEYANSFVEKYKVEPGGQVKLQEQKHWLNDDYVKFIALAEHMVSKNQEGIIGMITAHGYIDNPTFRGMRWHLRNTFDSIYVLDLHGNTNKKEVSPDGGRDENVFEIKTGVSIILGVKKTNSNKKNLAKIYKADLFGLQKDKFKILNSSNIETINWKELPKEIDSWVLEGKNKEEYKTGFSVSEVLPINNTGICTQRDQISIQDTPLKLKDVLHDFSTLDESELRIKYEIKKDGRDWKVKTAKEDVIKNNTDETLIKRVEYRPFDTRYTFFTGKSKGFIAYPRGEVFQHFFKGDNLGLIVSRQGIAANPNDYDTVFVSNTIVDLNYYRRGGEILCPLYLYVENKEKIPNIDKEIWKRINDIVGETTPENILDYIYAILHSPSYRDKYKEFLKIDFPRVPYPKDKKQFFDLVKLGEELRQIHLLESPKIKQPITTYSVAGSDIVEKITFKDGKVFINSEQYFGGVPEVAWNFYIGGYQPAQKWLKDRKGRTLSSDDIEHYQKIIVALTETDKIMREIDRVWKN